MRVMQLPDALRHAWIGPLARPGQALPPTLAGGWQGMAARLREIEDAFARADFDQGRVDALRRAIDQGQFRVDPARVADGLLASVIFSANSATGTKS